MGATSARVPTPLKNAHEGADGDADEHEEQKLDAAANERGKEIFVVREDKQMCVQLLPPALRAEAHVVCVHVS